MKKSNIEKWCIALDSGKYTQTVGRLQDAFGHCCLGVACEIFIPKDDQRRDGSRNNSLMGTMPTEQHTAPKWLKEISYDFKKLTDNHLSDLNDNQNFTFSEIATLLELVYIHKILE